MDTWINGRARTRIDHRDRGLHYGDGLFETMRVRRRRIRLLDYHLERLFNGCRRLKIAAPNAAALRRELCTHAARRTEGVLKLIVTRGVGPRGYRVSGAERTTRIISLHRLPRRPAPAPPATVRVRVCSTRVGANPALAGLKTLNRLESVVARGEWRDARIWDGLMCDCDGHLISGTMSNLFVRHGPKLMTPLLDRCGVAGVMRRWVFEQARGIGLDAIEARLEVTELKSADEVFMTNAVAGIVSVAHIYRGNERWAIKSAEWADRLRARLDLL